VEIDLTIDQLLSQNPSMSELKVTFDSLLTPASTASGDLLTADLKAVMRLPTALKVAKALIDYSQGAIAMLKRSEQLTAGITMAVKS
jgi:hypothetical protein